MAKKPTKKAPTTAKAETKVTRISASDSKTKTNAPKAKQSTTATKPAKATQKTTKKAEKPVAPNKSKRKAPKEKKDNYFRGAWYELKQVRWPDRPATWKMTGALLLFCAFFIVLVVLFDTLFQYLFNLMLG